MNIGWNVETYISVLSFALSLTISIIIVKLDWKKYGFLYFLSAIIGVISQGWL